MAVPDVLLSGNHEEIARWRHEQSVQRTTERRPDLLSADTGSTADPTETLLQMTGLNR